MKLKRPDSETWFEAGLLLMGAGLLSALGVLLMGRSARRVQSGQVGRQPAPAQGSVSPDRNQNVQSVSAR